MVSSQKSPEMEEAAGPPRVLFSATEVQLLKESFPGALSKHHCN